MATLTVYPDPSPEVTTVDGYVLDANRNTTWATIISNPGTTSSDTVAGGAVIYIRSTTTTNQWHTVGRGIHLFDTSSLTSSANISTATMSIKGTLKSDGVGISPDINIYSSAPASNTALVAGDYDSLGSTAFSTAIGYSSYSTAAYNDFALNASGLSNISKTGVSKFGTRNANYDAAASAPTWNSGKTTFMYGAYAEASGTTTDPKLVVNYTLGSPASIRNSITII